MAPMWDRVDQLSEKYYGISPYAYCGGDPVNKGDYDGMKPDSLEAAIMSDNAYCTYNQKLIGGWELEDSGCAYENGLKYRIFSRSRDDKTTEYVLAFAGTEDWEDTKTDIGQATGYSRRKDGVKGTQYETAVNIAKSLNEDYANSELTIVGHSLGGGLSTVASMATLRDAITFNAAAVSDKTVEALGLVGASESQITNHIIVGDPVQTQSILGLSLRGSIIEHTISGLSITESHRITSFINAWKK